MKSIWSALLIIAIASCSTPGPITGRPDPNVSTSGTLGSVKATDRPPRIEHHRIPKKDTMRQDTLH